MRPAFSISICVLSAGNGTAAATVVVLLLGLDRGDCVRRCASRESLRGSGATAVRSDDDIVLSADRRHVADAERMRSAELKEKCDKLAFCECIMA